MLCAISSAMAWYFGAADLPGSLEEGMLASLAVNRP
jgi:predicted amidohydrolase YtcJ